jgi:hypothetical protein
VSGPFQLDPNTRALTCCLHDQACVVRLGSLTDKRSDRRWGALLFGGVHRISVVRAEDLKELKEREFLGDGWALESAPFYPLRKDGPKALREADEFMKRHRRYYVPDGNHHFIDVTAGSCEVTTVSATSDDRLASGLGVFAPLLSDE